MMENLVQELDYPYSIDLLQKGYLMLAFNQSELDLFTRNVAQIESLTNLAAIGEERVTVVILPLPIPGVDACPCRIVALKKGAVEL